jgi:hypothetical protein
MPNQKPCSPQNGSVKPGSSSPHSQCQTAPKLVYESSKNESSPKVCRFYLRLPTTSLFSWTSAFQLTQKSALPELAQQLQLVEARRNRAAILW